MKTILLFRSSFCRSNLLEYEGVFAYAKAHSWRIQTVEYMNAATNRYRLEGADTIPTISSLLELWKPAGCIVECGIAPHTLMKKDFGKIPVVFLDRDPKTVEPGAICVCSDSSAIATIAAHELLLLGLDNFAFVGWPEPVRWSKDREFYFRSIIRDHGKQIVTFRPPKTTKPESDLEELEKFLLSLPPPCGLFTANDVIAKRIVSACTHCKISIPDEIALVSVDNDEDICDHAPVTITSIELDCTGAGMLSAELLDLMMSRKLRKASTHLFGVSHLVRRKSAVGVRLLDKRMMDALEFIRVHACEKLSIADIVNVMGCSRRLADMRFRATLDHTILDEIHQRRIETAKLKLKHQIPIETVATQCGYASADDFGRVFRRYTGMSPREWKKQPQSASQSAGT